MTTHTLDPRTTQALRDLDPAVTPTGFDGLSPAEQQRAEATLARILSTAPDTAPARPTASRVSSSRRRLRRRLVLVPVGLAAAASAVVVPLVLTSGPAYASWSATPQVLTPVETRVAADDCARRHDTQARSGGSQLAERRGEWTYVLVDTVAGPASCLVPDDLAGRTDVRGGWFGSLDAEGDVPTPAADELVELTSALGTTDEGLFSWTEGVVGADVVAVAVTRPGGEVVQASVADGRYAAWWPAGADDPSNPEVSQGHVITYTLRDGSTRTVG